MLRQQRLRRKRRAVRRFHQRQVRPEITFANARAQPEIGRVGPRIFAGFTGHQQRGELLRSVAVGQELIGRGQLLANQPIHLLVSRALRLVRPEIGAEDGLRPPGFGHFADLVHGAHAAGFVRGRDGIRHGANDRIGQAYFSARGSNVQRGLEFLVPGLPKQILADRPLHFIRAGRAVGDFAVKGPSAPAQQQQRDDSSNNDQGLAIAQRLMKLLHRGFHTARRRERPVQNQL